MNKMIFGVCMVATIGLGGCRGALDSYYDAAYASLSDYAGTLRAQTCDQTTTDLAAINAAGPFEIALDTDAVPTAKTNPDGSMTACTIVGKGLKTGERLSVHGLELPRVTGAASCSSLKDLWAKEYDKFKQSLTLQNKLSCGADGKPTTALDSASELDARERAYRMSMSMIMGRQDVDIKHCYDVFKQRATGDWPTVVKLRCDILTKDAAVPGMTSRILLDRAKLSINDFDPGGTLMSEFTKKLVAERPTFAKDSDELEQQIDPEKLRLIGEKKAKYCTPAKELTWEERSNIAGEALSMCGGRFATETRTDGGESSSHAGDEGSKFLRQLQEAAAAKAKEEAETKRKTHEQCTDQCSSDLHTCQRTAGDDSSKRVECFDVYTKCNHACPPAM